MNRQIVVDAYEEIRPDEAVKERMLQNILFASDHTDVRKDVPMRKFKNKPLQIAAMLGVMFLLMGCAVVAMTLNDLLIGEETKSNRAYFNSDGEIVPAQEITRDVISLQGIAGSNNQLAAKEWYDFAKKYDLSEAENFQAPRAYDAYSVCNQEMIDKVDEIAQKYGLRLAGQKEAAREWQMDAFCEALGIASPLKEAAKVEIVWDESPMKEQGLDGYYLSSGAIYECGNFDWGFLCNITDPQSQWEWPVNPVVRYHDKEYLAVDFYAMENAETAEQWVYETEDGTQLLIVNDGDFVYMFCDREDAFITVQMNNCYYEDGNRMEMPREDIERMAEAIDFSMKPQKPDMAAAVKRLDALDQRYDEIFAAWEASFGDPFHKDSYRELAEGLNMKTYALVDLNGDGADECLLKGDHENSALYTMENGKTECLLDGGRVMYLCEDNVVEGYEVVGEEYYLVHAYYKMEGNEMVLMERIVFDRANDEWVRSLDGDLVGEETLTKEEAEKILAFYVRVDVEMKSISEFPEN